MDEDVTDVEEQICLFTEGLSDTVEAVSVWTGDKVTATKPEPWMLRLIPDGVYVLDLGGNYPMVLRPTPYGVDGIQECHEYMHFTIDGRLHAGIFVGRSNG